MIERPVIILGAGATKDCGGPLTDEILPAALNGRFENENLEVDVVDRENLLELTRRFLVDCFHVPNHGGTITKEDCPNLPMVLSMIRRAETSNLSIGNYAGDDLTDARRAVEYGVFAAIEAALRHSRMSGRNPHTRLLEPLYDRGIEPLVISLNYDVIVDNVMLRLAERNGQYPDYGVDFSTDRYLYATERGTFGKLLKIHGSLNWLYCDHCQRLDLFITKQMKTEKALDELYHEEISQRAYSCRGTKCQNPACDGYVRPILITPTFIKDYENKHVSQVWSRAEDALRLATRAIIIGYSLPSDDVEVAMLFQRGLAHLSPEKITVVEYVHGDVSKPPQERVKLNEHPVGLRYRAILGADLDWHTTGFSGWLDEHWN